MRIEKGRKGKGERRDGAWDGGGERVGSAPKLKLGPRTIFLGPALWKAHIGLPISVN